MGAFRTRLPTVLGLVMVLTAMACLAEPLQNDLFVVMKPQGMMGKSPLYPVFRTADRSDPAAAKYYDTIRNDPKIQEVLLRYQRAQTDSMRKYKHQLEAEGKSTAEIDKLLAKKANPIYFIVKDGKTTPMMVSGSAFIQTYKDGKIDTDFQYVCPKVMVYNGWEGFSTPPDKPFQEEEKKQFLNLVAHETSHAVMKEMYGYIPKGINPFAAMGHWEGKMTTPQLAFTEGYAEWAGAWYSGSDDYDDPSFTKDVDRNMPKTQSQNRRTEGVVACILWDIAKGDHGIKNGVDKLNFVLKEKKPWTIEGFRKGFKELFPNDAAALDKIMEQNLVTPPDPLITCWIEVRNDKARLARLEKELAAISVWKHPIAKLKKWWELTKAKSAAAERLKKYQEMFGYTLEQLNAPKIPARSKVPTAAAPAGPETSAEKPAASTRPVTQADPFADDGTVTIGR